MHNMCPLTPVVTRCRVRLVADSQLLCNVVEADKVNSNKTTRSSGSYLSEYDTPQNRD